MKTNLIHPAQFSRQYIMGACKNFLITLALILSVVVRTEGGGAEGAAPLG